MPVTNSKTLYKRHDFSYINELSDSSGIAICEYSACEYGVFSAEDNSTFKVLADGFESACEALDWYEYKSSEFARSRAGEDAAYECSISDDREKDILTENISIMKDSALKALLKLEEAIGQDVSPQISNAIANLQSVSIHEIVDKFYA